jgi:nuclear-control-of-ATPase protein 2
MNVSRAILHTLHAKHISVSISAFSPFFLKNLFPSPSKFTLRPGVLTTAFFPHLQNQTSLALAVLIPPPAISHEISMASMLSSYLSLTGRLLTLPLELTRQECRYNRKALETIRDQRAASLGQLANLRSIINGTGTAKQYKSFLCGIVQILSPATESFVVKQQSAATSVELLLNLSTSLLPSLSSLHTSSLSSSSSPSSFSSILRPGPLVLFWPHLLILPPLSLYLYRSHTDWVPAFLDLAHDAKETIRGFLTGWLIEPLKEVLRTIRGDEGQGGGGIVRTENVRADLEVRIASFLPLSHIHICSYSSSFYIEPRTNDALPRS